MAELYKWNTGRLYTSEGQRITAEVEYPTGLVHFMDHDREIGGVIQEVIPGRWTFMSSSLRIEWIMRHYDEGKYGFSSSAMDLRLEGSYPRMSF